VNKERRKWKKM